MKKYKVTLYFHTNVEIEVDADNEMDAIGIAQARLEEKKNVEQLLDGLQEDDSPDVEELDFEDVRLTKEQARELGYWD